MSAADLCERRRRVRRSVRRPERARPCRACAGRTGRTHRRTTRDLAKDALALGIGEVLLSFWLLARPGLTLVAAVLAIGLWALIAGVTQIIVAIDIKRLRDQGSKMDRGLSDMRHDLHQNA